MGEVKNIGATKAVSSKSPEASGIENYGFFVSAKKGALLNSDSHEKNAAVQGGAAQKPVTKPATQSAAAAKVAPVAQNPAKKPAPITKPIVATTKPAPQTNAAPVQKPVVPQKIAPVAKPAPQKIAPAKIEEEPELLEELDSADEAELIPLDDEEAAIKTGPVAPVPKPIASVQKTPQNPTQKSASAVKGASAVSAQKMPAATKASSAPLSGAGKTAASKKPESAAQKTSPSGKTASSAKVPAAKNQAKITAKNPAKKTPAQSAKTERKEAKEAAKKERKLQKENDKKERELEKKRAKEAKAAKKEQKSAKAKSNVAATKSSAGSKSSKKERKPVRVLFPIGRKLVAIISLIVVVALGALTYFVSYFVTQDFRISAEENNLAANSRAASDCASRIENVSNAFGMFVELLRAAGDDEAEISQTAELFFSHNKEIAAVHIAETGMTFSSSAFLARNRIERSAIESYMAQESDSLALAESGEFLLKNASPFFQTPIIAIFQPPSRVLSGAAVILYSSAALGESFSAGSINQSLFVNSDGELLASGDLEPMLQGEDESGLPVVQAMRDSAAGNNQITYLSESGEEFIGAFRKLKGGGGAVITTVKTSIILEGITRTTRRNIYITAIMFFAAALIIYFFSKTLSVPLSRLTAVVNEINTGNFNTELFDELSVKSHDEIGVLTESTMNEREILNTFTTLTNKGVTDAIIKRKIDFEPHLKDITIFFSDIRGFTAISDGFKKHFGNQSAAEIINFLNDYMSRMVQCIQLTGGTVDKFEGDAIMACWGVLRNNSLDWEQMELGDERRRLKQEHDDYVCEDAVSAITCCVAMRYALMKYNKDAEEFSAAHESGALTKYKPHIRIGAGLNSGRATVGFLGSEYKMEFTSIGDSVNFASRAEASNKPCGTDILISEDTYAILAKDFIRSKENNFTILPENSEREILVERIPVEFEVKGKGKQHFYGVVNMPNFDIEKFFKAGDPGFVVDSGCALAVGRKGPKTLAQLRELLGIPEPDFMKVNLNEEENKIQVASA